MLYLKHFKLLSDIEEHNIVSYQERRNIFNNYYPLNIFSRKELKSIDFSEITIFYGGNGSGKTTLLNIISKKINALIKSEVNKGTIFEYYVKACGNEMSFENPEEIKMISSDDVFDYLLDIRAINANVNRRKEKLTEEYLEFKYNNADSSISNYEELRKNVDAKKKTMSSYVRERLTNNNIIEKSNGESALMFWEQEIKENGLYILDEPENSLSSENQLKLKKFIEESTRFYNCQFIISTHSPFLLNLCDAKIYDLDSVPVVTKKWTELDNVRVFYDFFKEHSSEFK